MAASYLIDSDVCIHALRRGNASLRTLIEAIRPEGVAISVISYGEVYEGVLFSRQPAFNLQLWRDFVAPLDVIGVTQEIAEIWAGVRGTLRQRGRVVPDNDLIIAATALLFDMTLVTRNTRHFDRVEGLRLRAAD